MSVDVSRWRCCALVDQFLPRIHLILGAFLVCPVASDWRVKMCTLDNGKGLLEDALVGNFLEIPLLLVSSCCCFTRYINE